MRESYVEVSNGRKLKVQTICPLNELKNTHAYHLGYHLTYLFILP